MKTLYLIIIAASIAGGTGPVLLLIGTIENTSQETLMLRFSQSFFSILTPIALLIITLGSVIVLLGISGRKTHRQVTPQMILIGSIIIFLGVGVFSFYLID